MIKYSIYINSAAEKQIRNLPTEIRQKVNIEIMSLENNPKPTNCKKLKGVKNLYRVRVADFRIIYTIKDKTLTI